MLHATIHALDPRCDASRSMGRPRWRQPSSSFETGARGVGRTSGL